MLHDGLSTDGSCNCVKSYSDEPIYGLRFRYECKMRSKQSRHCGQENLPGCRLVNPNTRATRSLDICVSTEEHEWNAALREARAHWRGLSIFKSMVDHSSDQVCVLCYQHCAANGPAHTNTSTGRRERSLDFH